MPIEIHDWDAVRAAASWDTLLLGNGASIALSSTFSYQSLHGHATTQRLISAQVQQLFNRFHTTDFEFVLRVLWHADMVNQTIGTTNPAIGTAYADVRNALIQAVNAIHPGQASVLSALQQAVGFLATFDTIVTFNYDLTLYWAMLIGNTSLGLWFKDCFINNGEFESGFAHLRQPYPGATGATLVFFGHGALALATDIHGREVKISASGANLLDRVMAPRRPFGDGAWSGHGTADRRDGSCRGLAARFDPAPRRPSRRRLRHARHRSGTSPAVYRSGSSWPLPRGSQPPACRLPGTSADTPRPNAWGQSDAHDGARSLGSPLVLSTSGQCVPYPRALESLILGGLVALVCRTCPARTVSWDTLVAPGTVGDRRGC